MNFLSRLFKKKSLAYSPVSRLEQLFIEAGSDPSKRPEFYRTLFHFDLFCLGQAKSNPDGSETAQFRTSKFEGTEIIFAFTSKAALEWYISNEKLPPQSFIGFRASTLFEMLQGKFGLVLNPGHACTKHFTPSEVSEILKGFQLDDHAVTMPAGQQYHLGQPAQLPEVLLQSLARYSKSSPHIKEIYFGLLATDQGALRYLGVIEFKDGVSGKDQDHALRDLITISKETIEPGKVIDFSKLDESGFAEAISDGALKAVSTY